MSETSGNVGEHGLQKALISVANYKRQKRFKKLLQIFQNRVRLLVFSIYAKHQLLAKVGIDRKRKCKIFELSRQRRPITM